MRYFQHHKKYKLNNMRYLQHHKKYKLNNMRYLQHHKKYKLNNVVVEELETNLMSLVMFITLNICSTCFEH